MDTTTLTALVNNLPQAVQDFENEVAYMKYYMLFTTAALVWLILRDSRR